MDVIVVGAGPVGVLLAAELQLAGADPVVLEQRAGPSGMNRARVGIGPLATEALARRGLGPQLARHDEQGRPDKPGEDAELCGERRVRRSQLVGLREHQVRFGGPGLVDRHRPFPPGDYRDTDGEDEEDQDRVR